MTDEKLKDCIHLCWDCRHHCQESLFSHCLTIGGPHMEESHVRAMVDCIEICQTAADFMTRGSQLHAAICMACAAICEACARSCEKIGDEAMMACAAICRKCAESCRRMSEPQKAA